MSPIQAGTITLEEMNRIQDFDVGCIAVHNYAMLHSTLINIGLSRNLPIITDQNEIAQQHWNSK
jgi:hypothetical protein